MQKYKEINGNDYVKNSRTTINETMQSIQSMNSGTAFPTNNLFEGMKCYRTDLKKTYTLTDVANNTWVEDSHATLADEATHADSATKATNDKNGADITATYLKKAGDTATGDLTAPNFVGNLKGNADTATNATAATCLYSKSGAGSITIQKSGYSDYSPTVGGNYANMTIESWFGVSFTSSCGGAVPKGKTAVGVDCRDGIVRANSFEGALNGTATNADTVDGVHAGSFFYNKGDWADDNWATIGTYQVNDQQLGDNWYQWGQVISSSTNNARFQLYASDNYGDGRLHYRTGWDSRKNQWNTILDSENYNKFVPTKTGSGASGTWGINISGNADTASKLATARNIALTGNATGSATFDGSGNISISTNVNTATNADKLDGYHASDLLKKIAAANTVGIVAASLTENGYAKFANGLILQWGNARGRKDTENSTSFPIAFPSTCFTVLLTPKRYIVSTGIISQSKTSFTWEAECENVSWIAVGN